MFEKIIPKKYHQKVFDLKRKLLNKYHSKSYAQEGEDMVLFKYFENRKSGFYVDIGAHHPRIYSNTYFFYKKGWKGLNVDAMPGSMEAFKNIRPRDINIEAAISDKEEELTYYMFDSPALNGFSSEISSERGQDQRFKLLGSKKIKTRKLSEILDQYLPAGTQIDFMSIDIEGLDLQALKSNDWNKYRPEIILVECLNFNLQEPQNSETYNFLNSKNYFLTAKTFNTVFFKNFGL